MGRRSFLVAALAVLATVPGCGGKKSYGEYTTAELEKEVAGRLEFKEVSLTDKGDGVFTGTGKKATGEVYELTVTRSDRSLKWEQTHKDADGKLRFHGTGGVSQ